MNILITGSNGFVGGSIVRLCEGKYHTIGTGRNPENVSKTDEYIPWDMGKENCPELLSEKKIDVIVHAGACLDKNNNNEELIYANCLGTHRVFRLAQESGCRLLILLGGIPIVGEPKGTITEDTLPAPTSMYLATKAFQEMIFDQMKYTHPECRVINLRIPSPIGPNQPEKTIVPIFVRKALNGENISLAGTGSRKQNYVDVRDIFRAIELCMENEEMAGTYNIGSDEPVSNLELAKMCMRLAGSRADVTFSGMPDPTDLWVWDVDTSKLKAAGYRSAYTMEDTIADMIKAAR